MHVIDAQLIRSRQYFLGHQVASAELVISSAEIDLFDRKGHSGRYCCTWLRPKAGAESGW